MDPIAELERRLAKHPELRFEATASSVAVQAPSPEGFAVSFVVSGTECTVHFEGWHEDFTSVEQALDCFAFAFSGRSRLAITYRGRIPVKWVLEHLEEGAWQADSEVGHFLVPFWKPKRVVYRQNPMLLRDAH
jgi:hypothetical protein